jgi:nitrate reductase NapD
MGNLGRLNQRGPASDGRNASGTRECRSERVAFAVLQCTIELDVRQVAVRGEAQNVHKSDKDIPVLGAMNITGIVVYASPERSGAVRDALVHMTGVEVHAITPEGRMVVTVEQPDDGTATRTLDAIARVDGVLSTALVYHHDEPLDDDTNR